MTLTNAIVYVLADSREKDPVKRVRYVGRTLYPDRRLRAHRTTALGGERTARACWMRSVYASGGDVLLEPVELVNRGEVVQAEIAWIAHFRALGCRLINLTDGGEGLLNPSPETRERIGAAKRGHKFWVGRKHSPEARAKMAKARTGIPNPKMADIVRRPDVRAKIAATHRARPKPTGELLERKQELALRHLHSPEARARMRAAVSLPEHRAAISERQRTPAALARASQWGLSNKGRKSNDAQRAARSERSTGRLHSTATKAKMSAWQRGGDSHRAKLTWDQVRQIRKRHSLGGVSQHQLAREHGVTPRTINLIVHSKTWLEPEAVAS